MPLFRRKKPSEDIGNYFRFTEGYSLCYDNFEIAESTFFKIYDLIESKKRTKISGSDLDYDLVLLEAAVLHPYIIIITSKDSLSREPNDIFKEAFSVERAEELDGVRLGKLVTLFDRAKAKVHLCEKV